MFVNKVAEYGNSLNAIPSGYKISKISWVLDLDERSFVKYEGSDMAVPTSKRTGNIIPHIFADDSEYTFGVGKKGIEKHNAYMMVAREFNFDLSCLDDENFKQECLQQILFGVDEKKIPSALKQRILLKRGDDILVCNESVKNYISNFLNNEYISDKENTCLCCGGYGKIIRICPSKTFGFELVNFNNDSMETYGLSQNECAPMCINCAENYCNGLNVLINSENKIRYDDRVCLIWEDEEINISDILSNPSMEKIQSLNSTASEVKKSFDAVRLGSPQNTNFSGVNIALIKSVKNGRAVLISFEHKNAEEIKNNILNYFSYQEVPVPIKGYKKDGKYRVGMVDIFKDVKGGERTSHTYVSILNFALYGKKLPKKYLYSLVNKCSKPKKLKSGYKTFVSDEEQMLFRMFMEGTMIDENAFRLGEYLSIVGDIQRDAIGNVENDLVDKYFSFCLSSPKNAFVKLNEKNKKHMGKLRKQKPSHFVIGSQILSDICQGLELPNTFTIEQKASFCLGFHSKEKEKWDRIREAKERKENE